MSDKVDIRFEDAGTAARLTAALEKLNKQLDEMGKKAEKAEAPVAKLVSAKGLAGAGGAALAAAAAVATAAVAFTRLARDGSETQRAMDAMGDSFRQVQDATAGTVQVQSAFAARLTLTNSGLRISGQELATVARYAREHRQATETAEQALQRLTQSLREGEQGGLRQFGISVSQNATRAMTFESALRQMNASLAGTSPATRTLAEDVDRTAAAFTDGIGALANFGAQAINLQGIIATIGDNLREMISGLRDLQQLSQDLPEQARVQAQRQAAMERYRAAQADATSAAGALGVAGPQVNLAGLTPAQIDATAARLRAAAAAAGGPGAASPEALARSVNRTFNDAGDLLNRRGTGGPNPFAGAEGDADASAARTLAAVRPGAQQAARAVLEAELRRIAEDTSRMSTAATRQTPQGPRDSAPTGAAASNPLDVLVARMALGRVNETLALSGFAAPSGERGRSTAWDQIEALMRAAEDTGHRLQETELARLQRLTSARQAYHAAIVAMLREEAEIRRGIDDKAREGIERNAERQRRALANSVGGVDRARSMLGLDVTQAGIDAGVGTFTPEFVRSLRSGLPGQRERLGRIALGYESAIGDTTRAISGAQASITTARTEAERLAAEQRRNELMQQRIQLYGQLQQVQQQQLEVDLQESARTRAFTDAMVGQLESVTDAFGSSVFAALEGSKGFGEAMEAMARESIKAIGKQALVETIKNTAMGFGYLAVARPELAVNAFTAAGLWAAVGTAAGLATGLAPAPSDGKSKGSAAPAGAAARADRSDTAAGGPTIVNINVTSGVASTPRDTARAVRRVLGDGAALTGIGLPANVLGGF